MYINFSQILRYILFTNNITIHTVYPVVIRVYAYCIPKHCKLLYYAVFLLRYSWPLSTLPSCKMTPSRTSLKEWFLFRFPCFTRQPATTALLEPVSLNTCWTTASPVTTSSSTGGSLLESWSYSKTRRTSDVTRSVGQVRENLQGVWIFIGQRQEDSNNHLFHTYIHQTSLTPTH